MKDVISVDRILEEHGMDMFKPTSMEEIADGEVFKSNNRAKAKLHSLLISKLPEKRPVITADDLPKMKASNEAWNSAIDDMRKSIDEMFGSEL